MNVRRHDQTLRTLALLAGACLLWPSSTTAEDCGSPCTVTRQGLPTFRLVNTVSGIQNWDLETSAFGVELAPASDSANNGAFRVEHGALSTTLVIDRHGRVGIGTTAPLVDLQITDVFPEIRLNDFSSGSGSVDLSMNENSFSIQGNDGVGSIVQIDTRAPSTVLRIDENGRVGIGGTPPEALLHVGGDARIEGDIAIGSSRSLKTAFGPVSSSEILAAVADLPVASWRYETEEDSRRHIGPFAEDFQRLFGLGDGETISVVDAQGVAFAAIQGLARRLAEKEDELADLRSEKDAQIVELLARLATVEQRLDAETPSDGGRAAGGLR